MGGHLIPEVSVNQYSAAPSPTMVAAAKSLHETIRATLGSEYETFLQGSYRNDTGIAEINDVDIVAVRKQTLSTVFTPNITTTPSISWGQIFAEVQSILESSHHYRGKTERGDKCIKVNTGFRADVVPAVKIGHEYSTDPIAIYSFHDNAERKNYPRIHALNNVAKHQQTNQAYKPTVRMFKKWAKNFFPGSDVAPSFYLECLIHSVPNDRFHSDMAWSFFSVSYWIEQNVTTSSVVNSVAGDKNILVPNEWAAENFRTFKQQLDLASGAAASALQSKTVADALTNWRRAFNE